jgi:pyrroline-5-carboxylate reductase
VSLLTFPQEIEYIVDSTFELLKTMSTKELIERVASKGGTTEAGLKVIHNGGSWEQAAIASVKRAEELENQLENEI